MKITIVLGPFQPLPPAGIGAVEKVWHELAQAFARAGHTVLLIGKSTLPAAPSGADRVRVLGLPGYKASGRLWRDLVMDLYYALQVWRRIEPSDVIVTNSFWMPVVLALSGRGKGKIVVHAARFPKGQMSLYRGVDVLQAISSSVAQEIIRQSPGLAKKVRVLPYPVDLDTYRPPSTARRYHGDLTILYVGRLHPEKGLEMLLRAFRLVVARMPRVYLRIVGPAAAERGGGGAAYLELLKRAARGLPVEFAGPIADRRALASELQRAHCFCYPSLAEKGEAFGLAVLEAMATGLPVVVSSLACFNDFLEPGREGLVFDHRAQAPEDRLADALVKILAEPDLASRMGADAAKKAREFELEKVANRYLGLFGLTAGH